MGSVDRWAPESDPRANPLFIGTSPPACQALSRLGALFAVIAIASGESASIANACTQLRRKLRWHLIHALFHH